jgi:hypothetical protein
LLKFFKAHLCAALRIRGEVDDDIHETIVICRTEGPEIRSDMEVLLTNTQREMKFSCFKSVILIPFKIV